MPGMTNESAAVPCGSVIELVAFWDALARRLGALRSAAGLSEGHVARSAVVQESEVVLFESGERRPSLSKLLRMAPLYGATATELVMSAATDARPALGSVFEPVAEALMLYSGVTPEQFAGGVLDVDGVVAPTGDIVGRRDNNPRRLGAAMEMRRVYEGGASVRKVAEEFGVSFGTARKLLIEAGTRLRKPRRAPSVQAESTTIAQPSR